MRITLENDLLTTQVDTLGAQLLSLRRAGVEYLWQGDPAYWPDRAPILFPFIGRLWDNTCLCRSKPYPMQIHGFAAQSEFVPAEQTDSYLLLRLTHSDATLAQYPFPFELEIGYRLTGCTLETTFRVRNPGQEVMPFGIGGHPGFRVPWGEGRFEDCYLEFSCPCRPDRVGFTPAVFLSGQDTPYPLEDHRRLWLRHSLFDEDAVILKNMCREVTLRSTASANFITLSYPQMPYLGIWHWPKTDAPYVCIEPWSSLPGRHAVAEELTCKSDLIHLPPGKTYENIWTVTIGEE